MANIQWSRIVLKSSDTSFTIPSTPVDKTDEQYLVEGGFLPTDLLDCELGVDKVEEKLYLRIDDEIIEVGGGGFSGLTSGNGTTFNIDKVNLGGLLDQYTLIDGVNNSMEINNLGGWTLSVSGIYEEDVLSTGLSGFFEKKHYVGQGHTVQRRDAAGNIQSEFEHGQFGFVLKQGNSDLIVQNGVVSRLRQGNSYLNMSGSGVITLFNDQSTIGLLQPYEININSDYVTNQYGGRLNLNAIGNVFTDHNSIKKGLEYNADYSATYTNRSLVDKQYVDSLEFYGGERYTLIKPNGTKQYYDTLSQVRLNWADGDVLHQFGDEEDITYVNNSATIMFAIPSISWIGNGFKTKVNNINVNGGTGWDIAIGKTCYFSGVNLNANGNNITNTLIVRGILYNTMDCTFKHFIQLSRASSTCVTINGTMYGGNVLPDGVTDTANQYPRGLGGTGTCYGVNTSGYQVGGLTNFVDGRTTYPCATNYRNCFCDFGEIPIGNNKVFDTCEIRSTRNNNDANFSVFTARNCNIIHTPSTNTHTFYNIFTPTLINCTFTTTGRMCNSVSGAKIIGGYISFNSQTYLLGNNYNGLVDIRDCTIEATNANSTTDILLLENVNGTNVKINNVTFINPNGRSDIRLRDTLNIEWKNCKFSKGNNHITASVGTVGNAYFNNPARLNDPKGFLNNTGNGNWFMYVPMTTTERDALSNVSRNFTIENITTNELQIWNGTTWDVIGGSSGPSNIKQTSSITEPTWSGNTNYTKTFTVTGAAVGDSVVINVTTDMTATCITAGVNLILNAHVTSANTVQVWGRVATFISIPSGAEWIVTVLK
jgi:hypothetical protein